MTGDLSKLWIARKKAEATARRLAVLVDRYEKQMTPEDRDEFHWLLNENGWLTDPAKQVQATTRGG